MDTVEKKIDDLAGSTHREFTAVREEMGSGFKAVRAEIGTVRGQMDSGFNLVLGKLEDIEQGNKQILSAVEALMDSKLQEFHQRVSRIDKKLGIQYRRGSPALRGFCLLITIL